MRPFAENLDDQEARRRVALAVDALLAIVAIEISKQERSRPAAVPEPPSRRDIVRRRAAEALREHFRPAS